MISTQGDTAVLEVAGQRQTLRVGDSPVSVGKPINTATGSAHRVVRRLAGPLLHAGPGQLPAGPVPGRHRRHDHRHERVSDADRIGLQYKQGQPVQVSTANGVVPGWRIRLSSVRLSDVEVRDIEAVITPIAMPFVLLGNSYLTRFQMTRNNEQMVLEKRY